MLNGDEVEVEVGVGTWSLMVTSSSSGNMVLGQATIEEKYDEGESLPEKPTFEVYDPISATIASASPAPDGEYISIVLCYLELYSPNLIS